MYRKLIYLIGIQITLVLNGQEKALDLLISDSSMYGASASLCILDAGSGTGNAWRGLAARYPAAGIVALYRAGGLLDSVSSRGP